MFIYIYLKHLPHLDWLIFSIAGFAFFMFFILFCSFVHGHDAFVTQPVQNNAGLAGPPLGFYFVQNVSRLNSSLGEKKQMHHKDAHVNTSPALCLMMVHFCFSLLNFIMCEFFLFFGQHNQLHKMHCTSFKI